MTLIERLEKATEGSRELDAAIQSAVDPFTCFSTEWERMDATPNYTTSVDAALTLVPEGWLWDVASTGCVWVMPEHDIERQIVVGGVSNPIIAICIAALKARGEKQP